jgi:hypothetical protein
VGNFYSILLPAFGVEKFMAITIKSPHLYEGTKNDIIFYFSSGASFAAI